MLHLQNMTSRCLNSPTACLMSHFVNTNKSSSSVYPAATAASRTAHRIAESCIFTPKLSLTFYWVTHPLKSLHARSTQRVTPVCERGTVAQQAHTALCFFFQFVPVVYSTQFTDDIQHDSDDTTPWRYEYRKHGLLLGNYFLKTFARYVYFWRKNNYVTNDVILSQSRNVNKSG